MFHSTVSKSFLIAILGVVSVFIGACGRFNEHKNLRPIYKYAEVKGNVTEGNQINTISRWVFVAQDGSKAVVSEINSVTHFSGQQTSSMRYLREYLHDDSLFIYDSVDSTSIRVALSDPEFKEFNLLPLSASWLLLNHIKSEKSNTDTLTICGYCSKKEIISTGYLWVSGNLPMAIETLNQGIHHSERIVRCVDDTILPKGVFKQPLGYRELVPTR